MSDQNKKKPFFHENHAKPVTRRDFLAQGFTGMLTWSIMPSALGMILNEHTARAADCPRVGAEAGLVPFLVFDMAGGGALMGNWTPLDQGGQPLPSYNKMGLGATAPAVTEQFGAPMATNLSKILEGILANTTPEARARLRMGMLAHPSLSDTNTNLHSAVLHAAKAGLTGSLVRAGTGTENSLAGGNSKSPISDSTLKPLQIRGVDDFAKAIQFSAGLTGLVPSQIRALAKATLNLSAEQAGSIASLTLGEQFGLLARCGYARNLELLDAPASDIDPRQDAIMRAIYGITETTNQGNGNVRLATIVSNVLKGNSGPGVITFGGCDYHDGGQTSGDAKDRETGNEIGRAVQAAYNLGKPLVFQILTDGGIYSDDNTRNWRGDDNSKSLSIVGCIRPTAAPNLMRKQIGHYTTGQGAASGTVIGGDPRKVAHAVFANYLQLSGRMDLLENVVTRQELDPSLVDGLLLFG